MKIERLKAISLEIPFKTNFKHASADRAKTASIWIEACSNHGALIGYGEGCPREYVTGENLKSALDWINRHTSSIVKDITNLKSLKAWVVKQEQVIDKDPAAWCAIELALLDLLGKAKVSRLSRCWHCHLCQLFSNIQQCWVTMIWLYFQNRY
ncbi:MAG: hypothetical protein IPN81_10100 [Nitrosomonadales bacterium]|nr:hypothetical protein [Nitrosomonadales bacterium]